MYQLQFNCFENFQAPLNTGDDVAVKYQATSS